VTLPAGRNRVGEIVGDKYRIVRFLAQGGMAAVYEARHVVVKRRFAVKFLRPDLTLQRGILERFQREAETAGSLEKENVAAALDFGIATDGSPYIVMEYLVGETLAQILAREGRLPIGRATDLCLQASRGLGAAHGAGIIHRDLKPQNLFVCRHEDGCDLLKVLDFGVAKLEEAENQGMVTRTGATLGTPFYMSPEQARGEKDCDERTDVYGLGAVLYELLSGQRPHVGNTNNAVLHHIATQPAIPLGDVAAGLPTPLVEIVHRCLAHNPSERFPSMGELAEALAPFARREPWPAPSLVVTVGDGTVGDGEVPSTEAARELPPAAARRSRGMPFVLASVALVLAAAGALLFLRGHATSPKSREAALPADTQFFVPPTQQGATAQIASLAHAPREAAALTAMTSTPRGLWLIGGTPDEVRSTVRNTMIRAGREKRVPILVPYNHPYRDCAGYGAGGAEDSAAYRAWIEGVIGGIGNERAVVILEPHSIGIVPNNTLLDGRPDWCKPTVTNPQGNAVPTQGATPEERWAQLNYALDRLASEARNVLVYLDGTHGAWLPVGEVAFRLDTAGIAKAQGFTVNVSTYEATPQSIQYGTWVSKCLAYANHPTNRERGPQRYADCPGLNASNTVDEVNRWYAAHVDSLIPAVAPSLPHFVIDTSRNGQGPLDVAPFGLPPYNQPKDVLAKLSVLRWCNPPGARVGQAPTANTGVPLLDAFLWIKNPGESDGSCNIAGGGRAWDYSQCNPWGITGDAQNHFDPLWGMVDPGPGEWFPAQALELALK
jgi:endoglucanase